jgi:transcriptional regulator with XRE-family HTH domain
MVDTHTLCYLGRCRGGRERDGRNLALDDVIAGIGGKIRLLRQANGLSLQQLADRSGVSAASIHKIERSTMVPTITVLMKLARSLDRSVSYLIDEEDTPTSPVVLIRADERQTLFASREGMVMENLAGPAGRFSVSATMVTVAAGCDSGKSAIAHPGEDLVYVLDGTLEFEIDGAYRIGQGDTLHFPTDHPHRWRNPTDRPAKAIWVSFRRPLPQRT